MKSAKIEPMPGRKFSDVAGRKQEQGQGLCFATGPAVSRAEPGKGGGRVDIERINDHKISEEIDASPGTPKSENLTPQRTPEHRRVILAAFTHVYWQQQFEPRWSRHLSKPG